MYIYKKIGKYKNIVYYFAQNNINSKYSFILADMHKIENHESHFEEVVAWVTKSKSIDWNEDYTHIINKDYIKNFIVNL